MKKQCITNHIGGTYQDDRFPKALDPSSVKIDGRSFEELIQSFVFMAGQMNYFKNNPEVADMDWKPFFAQIIDERGQLDLATLKELESSGEMQPHLALMLAFLKVYGIEEDGINELTKQHLDFYYREMLRFKPKQGTIGHVPVAVKLGKTTQSAFIPAGTKFLAGKDDKGKVITYINQQDFTAYASTIESQTMVDSSMVYPKKSERQCGIILSSPLLNVKGITNLHLNTRVGYDASYSVIYYTTEEGWANGTIANDHLSFGSTIAPYNEKVHKMGLSTSSPVIFIPYTSIDNLLSSIKTLPTLNQATVSIPDESVKLKNKMGILNNGAQVQPFGSLPSLGDVCKVLIPEVEGYSTEVSISDNTLWTNNPAVSKVGDTLQLVKDYGYQKYLRELIIATNDIAQNKESKAEIPLAPKAPTLEIPLKVTGKYKLTDNKFCECFIKTPQGVAALQNINDLNVVVSKGKNMYVGIKNAKPETSISLYVELQKDGEIVVDEDEENPTWYVLSGIKWVKASVLRDNTRGLVNDGIVHIDFSDEAIFESHKLMQPNLTWLRLAYGTAIRPMVEKVTPHVVDIMYDPESLGKGKVGEAMPKGSVKKLQNAVPGVKSIEQFCEGERGKNAENDREFNVRVSERLRHKGRASNVWDYERLVLQEFPTLAAVKCVPFQINSKNEKGTIELLLVPKVIEMGDLEPKVKDNMKESVKAFLADKISPFAKIKVVDHTYEQVKVSCTLYLREGYTDKSEYTKKAIQALKEYLSPWSNGKTGMLLSNNYNESQIMLFLEKLEYVDNVRDLKVKVCTEAGETFVGEGGDIIPSTPTSILTASNEMDITIKTSNSK